MKRALNLLGALWCRKMRRCWVTLRRAWEAAWPPVRWLLVAALITAAWLALVIQILISMGR